MTKKAETSDDKVKEALKQFVDGEVEWRTNSDGDQVATFTLTPDDLQRLRELVRG